MKGNVKVVSYLTKGKTAELENKLNELKNTIEAIGFLSMSNIIILMFYMGIKGF